MKFGCIIADPAWPYQPTSGTPKDSGRVSYPTMTVKAIAALPVRELAAVTSVLMLWTTPVFSAEGHATEVCRAWGFRPVTYTYWIKTTTTGKPVYGVGYWFRGGIEPVLIGTRGRSFRTNERGAFFAARRGHSVKPDYIHELAERWFPEPRLELFARKRRPGWVCVGHGATGADVASDIRTLIAAPDEEE